MPLLDTKIGSSVYFDDISTDSIVSVVNLKLRSLVDTLETQALEWPKIDANRYKLIINELNSYFEQSETFGEFYDLIIKNAGTPAKYLSKNIIDQKKCETELSKSQLVSFFQNVDNSSLRTGVEKLFLDSINVWFFYNLFFYQFEAISNAPQDTLVQEIDTFISLGFHLASLLGSTNILLKGLLLDINVLNFCVEIGNNYQNKLNSQKFLHMISAITVSHISNPILNETLSQFVEANRTRYNNFDKWTGLFTSLCPPNHIPQKSDGPSIFDVFLRMRMLPSVHFNTWSLEDHYTSVFADMSLTDYIPISCELLTRSKRSTQNLNFLFKTFHSFESAAQVSLVLDEILKLFKSPLGLDIAALKLNDANIIDGLSKMIVTPCMPISVVEKSKFILNILLEKRLKHHLDLGLSLPGLVSVAGNFGVSSKYCVDRIVNEHLNLMFQTIDGSESVFKNSDFFPIICLVFRVLEKTSQTLQGLNQFNLKLSELNGPLSSSVFISQLIYQLGKYLLKSFGQSCNSFITKSFERPGPQITLGVYQIDLESTKKNSSSQKTGVLNEYHNCFLMLVIVLYRNIYLCSQVFRGNTDSTVTWIRKKELGVLIDALSIAYDVSTIRYPSSFGGTTLHNVVLEAFKLLYSEYDKAEVQKKVYDKAMESIKFKYLARELALALKDSKYHLDDMNNDLEYKDGAEIELDLNRFWVSNIGQLSKPSSSRKL